METDNKVVFSDTRAIKIITIPAFPGSKIEIYTELNVWQQREVQNSILSDYDRGIKMALISIKDWNFSLENGDKLPISEETLKQFKDIDIMPIFAAVTGKTPEEFEEFIKDQKANNEIKKNIVA